jgi:hypothetical protein
MPNQGNRMRVICIDPTHRVVIEEIDPVASAMMSLISHRFLQLGTELDHGDGLYTFERYFGLRDGMEPFHLLSPSLTCFGDGLVVGRNADGSLSFPKSSVQRAIRDSCLPPRGRRLASIVDLTDRHDRRPTGHLVSVIIGTSVGRPGEPFTSVSVTTSGKLSEMADAAGE